MKMRENFTAAIIMGSSSKNIRLSKAIEPVLKPYFVLEIFARHQWEQDFSWPLMDMVYLLAKQEEEEKAQAVYVKELIEHNPVVINALKTTIAQMNKKNPKIEIHPKVYVQYRTGASVYHRPIMRHNHAQVIKLIREFQVQENTLPVVTKSEIRQNGRNKNVQAFMKFIHSISNYYQEHHKEPKRKSKLKEQEMTKILQELMIKSPVIQNTYFKQAVDRRISLLSAHLSNPRNTNDPGQRKIYFSANQVQSSSRDNLLGTDDAPRILMKTINKDNKAKVTQKLGTWLIQKSMLKILGNLYRGSDNLKDRQSGSKALFEKREEREKLLEMVKQHPRVRIYKTYSKIAVPGLKNEYLLPNQFRIKPFEQERRQPEESEVNLLMGNRYHVSKMDTLRKLEVLLNPVLKKTLGKKTQVSQRSEGAKGSKEALSFKHLEMFNKPSQTQNRRRVEEPLTEAFKSELVREVLSQMQTYTQLASPPQVVFDKKEEQQYRQLYAQLPLDQIAEKVYEKVSQRLEWERRRRGH